MNALVEESDTFLDVGTEINSIWKMLKGIL
jgi:hypothetical protein